MKKISIAIILIGLTLIVFCCKDQLAPTREEFLAGAGAGECRSWKISQVYINNIESTHSIKTCMQDDIFIFCKDHRFQQNEGLTQCTVGTNLVMDGYWQFSKDKNYLYIVDSLVADTSIVKVKTLKVFKVDELLKDELKLTFSEGTQPNISTWKETFTLK